MVTSLCLLTKVIVMGAVLAAEPTISEAGGQAVSLFDFTKASNVDGWMESSDTVRTVGKSKAVLALQKTQEFQRGIFFTLLNPQVNGAAFAGVRTPTNLNLTGYDNIEILCRAQGSSNSYKVVLRHKGLSNDNDASYEQIFPVTISESPAFETISLGLSKFKPYFRGKPKPNAEPLDISNITMFGLQVYGGVYSDIKQKGVSSLEIETIVATAT